MTTERVRSDHATTPVPVNLKEVDEWVTRLGQIPDTQRQELMDVFIRLGSIEQNLAVRKYLQDQRKLEASRAEAALKRKAQRQYANALMRELHKYWRFTSLRDGVSSYNTWQSVPVEYYSDDQVRAVADAAWYAAKFGFNVYRRLPKDLLGELAIQPHTTGSHHEWARLRLAVDQLIRFEDKHFYAVIMAITTHHNSSPQTTNKVEGDDCQEVADDDLEPKEANNQSYVMERVLAIRNKPYFRMLPNKVKKILSSSQEPVKLNYAIDRHDRIMAYHDRFSAVALVERAENIYDLVSSKVDLFAINHRRVVAQKLGELKSLLPDHIDTETAVVNTIQLADWIVTMLQIVSTAEAAQPEPPKPQPEEIVESVKQPPAKQHIRDLTGLIWRDLPIAPRGTAKHTA